jgi:hypothetical protein
MQIIEAYAGIPKRDWVAISESNKIKRDGRMKAADAAGAPAAAHTETWTPADLNVYVSTFKDPWRGEATVARQGDSLQLTFSHTNALSGPLVPAGLNLFIVHWKDRSLDADAYVRFSTDYSGKVAGFTMQAVSATTDFSYDFQDLDFRSLSDSWAGRAARRREGGRCIRPELTRPRRGSSTHWPG